MSFYTWGKSVYPLIKRMVMLHSVSGRFGGGKNLLALPGIELHFLGYTARCVVLIHNNCLALKVKKNQKTESGNGLFLHFT